MTRIAVFGIGAMGCLFGGRLNAHADVTLVGSWPAQIERLSNGPLLIHELDGTSTEVDLAITNNPAALEPVDIAFVLTKSVRTRAAARGVSQVIKPDSLVITLQNGLGNLEVIADMVTASIISGITMQGATVEGPGIIRHGGDGPTYLVTDSRTENGVAAVAELLRQAGIETHVTRDVGGLIWAKLVVNAGINPLSAILGVTNGALLDSEAARSIMRDAAREVEQVARAKDIVLPFEDAAEEVERVATLTAANRSSMLQDIERGQETEIEAICGAVIWHGEQANTPTPVNDMLYRLVKAIEQARNDRAAR